MKNLIDVLIDNTEFEKRAEHSSEFYPVFENANLQVRVKIKGRDYDIENVYLLNKYDEEDIEINLSNHQYRKIIKILDKVIELPYVDEVDENFWSKATYIDDKIHALKDGY